MASKESSRPHSVPLDRERVNFLRSDVAGEDGGAIGDDADLGIAVGARGARKVLQAGDQFQLMVGQPDAQGLCRLRKRSGNQEIPRGLKARSR
jgi:hypothetical protein